MTLNFLLTFLFDCLQHADGITDLEAVESTQGADLFIGYGGVVERKAVAAGKLLVRLCLSLLGYEVLLKCRGKASSHSDHQSHSIHLQPSPAAAPWFVYSHDTLTEALMRRKVCVSLCLPDCACT